ncbi:Zinc finger CCCH domain-containing protein 25 [Acorus calamus]|uniref:Zinc finger CCCH domain-containing protein 25 n=1 Tax=Acorus calamus TaxID=4465 RepID=A0AAV9ECV7_ACOCL|nr:Zinc finger CCCH domain-containing protein 25 [Acorus calamus]
MASSSSSQHRCVFVGNIPYDATEEQLIQICEEVGPVVSFRLVLDRETGKPKGYGFCEYKDEETALSARRNLQGYEINGRQLRVDFAENDKGSDRNREQGRGGPGLASNIDVHRQSGGPLPIGDPTLYQPIGLPSAAAGATVMAGALGKPQTSSMYMGQNGFPGQSGIGNDPLTQYLAKMSRHQLYEIMSEMKALATHNKELARQLLQASPQLPKALFQAQIMLGMVTPQVLQMPNIRQSSLPLQEGIKDQKPIIPPHHVHPMHNMPVSSAQQAAMLSQNPGFPSQHAPVQPLLQHPQQSQFQSQAAILGKPILPYNGYPIHAHAQSPLLQQPIPAGPSSVPHQTFPVPGANGMQQTEKQSIQLPSDVDRGLLDQVLSLTAEQLNLLPPEQRQQVIQLQQILRVQM